MEPIQLEFCSNCGQLLDPHMEKPNNCNNCGVSTLNTLKGKFSREDANALCDLHCYDALPE